MLSQLTSLSPRRLLALGLVAALILLSVLLIVLWQVGLFDSAPPPATIESAVESVRQEQQAQQSDDPQQTQAQAQQQETQPVEQEAQSDPASPQPQQESSAADRGSEQDSQTRASVASADEQERPAQTQDQDAEPQQASQDSQAQQTQQQARQIQQQSQQQTMTPEALSLADLAGSWVLSTQGVSFVGYRIGEELANIGTTTAVGRTGDIVASLEFDGAAITSVVIEADLRTLESDQSFRDGALRTRGIETDTYPFATFILAEPIPIEALPIGEEETLSVTVQGSLDLHGVTNAVSIALEGRYVDGLVIVVGSTEIALADYDIEPPTGFRVLSIDDIGIMEFQLVLERAP